MDAKELVFSVAAGVEDAIHHVVNLKILCEFIIHNHSAIATHEIYTSYTFNRNKKHERAAEA